MLALPSFASLATAFLLLASAPLRVDAASAVDWQKRAIYQVMTDRFALPNNSASACDTSQQLYCGGTWSGITDHLDYIQGMGFTALWISPIVAQLQVPLPPPPDGTSYHGYWPQDLLSLNPAFGAASDLLALSSALHARGMYLMLDIVVNHVGALNTSDAPLSFTNYVPFNAISDFHPYCPIVDDNNQTEVEQCWLSSPGAVPLADVNTESDSIVSFYSDWIKQTVANYSIDGLRIDTVHNVRRDFFPGFTSAAGVFALGEVLVGDAQEVGNYTNYIDAVFDYPTWFVLTQAFQNTTGSMQLLQQSIQNVNTYYKSGGLSTASFLENQDQPRFASLTSDQSLIKNAITFTFVNDGIPVLYQGQEQGYTGGAVPNNREALWLSGYVEQKPIYEHVTTLNRARQAAQNASSSFISTKMQVLSTSTNNIALLKPPLLAVLSNAGNASSASWSVPFSSAGSTSGFAAGAKLVEVLTCTAVSPDASGNLNVTFAQGAPQLFMPASALGSSLCPSLAAKPTSGATSVTSRAGLSVVGCVAAVLAFFALA